MSTGGPGVSHSSGNNTFASSSAPEQRRVVPLSPTPPRPVVTSTDEESPLLFPMAAPANSIMQNTGTSSSATNPGLPFASPLHEDSLRGDTTRHTEYSTNQPGALSSSLSTSGYSNLSQQNMQPTAPTVFADTRPSTSQRRRLGSHGRQRRVHGNTAPSLSSSSITSVSNASLRRSTDPTSPAHQHRGNNGSNGNNSLRASLDAGMAAMQRWIRSRANETPQNTRSVSWSSHPHGSSSGDAMSLSLPSAAPRGDEESQATDRSLSQVYHPTIFEEEEDAMGATARQRALSESDAVRIRDYFRPSGSTRLRRRGAVRSENTPGAQLSSSAAAALYTTTSAMDSMGVQSPHSRDIFISPSQGTSMRPRSVTDGGLDSFRSTMEPFETSRPFADPRMEASSVSSAPSEGTGSDPELRARIRWIQINRRFQFVITAVALLFSLLLFGILICWVILTTAYVVSLDKSCDVPLKPYFWLVTFQLVLDVFRSDIMRFVFSWDSSSNQRIPVRVIAYNVTYLLYAFMVLRLGILSVFTDGDSNCRDTAPELVNASAAFVSLSIAAWLTIICGYLLPFIVVAALLTCNGYNPSSSSHQTNAGATQPVYPAAYATTGAPPGTIELLSVRRLEDFPQHYPQECCICMEPFGHYTVVETSCKHVFHKQCCREWLRQARSCPVCRMDIPASCEVGLSTSERSASATEGPQIPIGPTGRPVVGLWRILRPHTSGSTSFGATSSSENRV